MVYEVRYQVWNVFAPFNQRRQRNRDAIQPVEEILAKLASPHVIFQAVVGGGNHTHIDTVVGLSADSTKLSVLQNLKKFGLQAGIEVSNFIQKQRTLVR
jgi:hypothetical protein